MYEARTHKYGMISSVTATPPFCETLLFCRPNRGLVYGVTGTNDAFAHHSRVPYWRTVLGLSSCHRLSSGRQWHPRPEAAVRGQQPLVLQRGRLQGTAVPSVLLKSHISACDCASESGLSGPRAPRRPFDKFCVDLDSKSGFPEKVCVSSALCLCFEGARVPVCHTLALPREGDCLAGSHSYAWI